MFYFKKIVSYFDYYENHEKKKNCGYGKILIRDEEVTLEIHIRGLGIKESHMCDICIDQRQEKQLGRFVLDKGTGYYNAHFHSRDMDGNGLSVFDINGLFIPIDENKYCETYWEWGELPINIIIKDKIQGMEKEKMESSLREQTEEKPTEDHLTEITTEREPETTETKREIGVLPSVQKINDTETEAEGEMSEKEVVASEGNNEIAETEAVVLKESIEMSEGEAEVVSSIAAIEESTTCNNSKTPANLADSERPLHKVQLQSMGNRIQGRNAPGKIPVQDPLHVDKWKQLCSQYPVCHPFEDGEEYISIAPKDFIILRKEYQNLVSNSFLLHSFYNYHHVILGKAGKEDSDMYYIGVPGNYLDREKRVAVMFGFEGFAMSARGNRNRNAQRQERIPAETGAFGYYMRKVEI